MFVIFIAHMPANPWYDYIPARFGFSSAAELFVFCSGLASSLAFGKLFLSEGFWLGTRRILFRIWQVFWAHIGLALVMIAISVAAVKITGEDYTANLGLNWLFANAAEGFLRLMTLRFTPNFLDILPMYLVLLAMIPVMMLAHKIHRMLPLVIMPALWIFVQRTGFNLVGGPEPQMMWFFNPFAWQLVFFTGFSFGMGWLKAPKLEKGWLFWLSVAILIVSVPLNFWAFTDRFPILTEMHNFLVASMLKTNLPLPHYVHFLASAYVTLVLVDPIRDRLHTVRPVIMVGQQALAAFMTSITAAWVLGMVLDHFGRGALAVTLANLAGFALLIGVAKLASIYKGGKSGGGKANAPQPAAKPDAKPAGSPLPQAAE